MAGSVPSVRSIAVPIGDILKLHPIAPVEVFLETAGGSQVRVIVPTNGVFEIRRGTDITHFQSYAVPKERGLRVVDNGGEEE